MTVKLSYEEETRERLRKSPLEHFTLQTFKGSEKIQFNSLPADATRRLSTTLLKELNKDN